MKNKYRGKIDCTEEELQDILSQYKDNKLPCPVDENGWVYGNLINGKTPFIVGEVVDSFHDGITVEYWYPVKKETLGQCIGLKDKNGTEIYEGDIVKWGHINCHEDPIRIGVVEINPDIQFNVNVKGLNTIFKYGCFAYQETEKYLEVIGNIYDNPELSEVRK